MRRLQLNPEYRPKVPCLNDSEERKIPSTALVRCSTSRIAGNTSPDFKSKLGLTPQHLVQPSKNIAKPNKT